MGTHVDTEVRRQPRPSGVTLRRLSGALLTVALTGSMLVPGTVRASTPRQQPARPAASPLVLWSPGGLGTITLRQGQTVYRSVYLTAMRGLRGAAVYPSLSVKAAGTAIQVLTTAYFSQLDGGDRIHVVFAIVANRAATVGVYPADLHVVALHGQAESRVSNDLDFAVDVDQAVQPKPPVIVPDLHWTPGNLGVLTVHQGQGITRAASFVSDAPLSGLALRDTLATNVAQQGLSVNITSPIPASVGPNVPVPVTFVISAAPTAPIHYYRDRVLYVTASKNGGAPALLHYGLHFTLDVDRAPVIVPHLTWVGGSAVAYPTVRRGTIATETASFTSNATLTNVRFVRVLHTPVPGVVITVAPQPIATIAAGDPTTLSITIDATRATRTGLFGADIYAVGQPAGYTHAIGLHYGLHFDTAVGA